jgi:hypothetical protein
MWARPAAVELLEDLARVLIPRRWYLFGAQAVNLLGRPRMTADVDVTVEVDRKELARFIDDLRTAGFELRIADPDAFLKATSVIPLFHPRTGMPLDLVLAGSGLETLFLDRAQQRDVGGLVVPVISPSDLLVAKILAGRTKDLEDAVGVLRERPDEVDLNAVRSLLGQIEQALDQSDLLPCLDQIVADALPDPKPKGSKRGGRSKRRKR